MNYQEIKLWLRGAWRSATIWFNSTGYLLIEYLVNNVDNYEQYITNKQMMYIIIIGNLLLRAFKTKSALKDK